VRDLCGSLHPAVPSAPLAAGLLCPRAALPRLPGSWPGPRGGRLRRRSGSAGTRWRSCNRSTPSPRSGSPRPVIGAWPPHPTSAFIRSRVGGAVGLDRRGSFRGGRAGSSPRGEIRAEINWRARDAVEAEGLEVARQPVREALPVPGRSGARSGSACSRGSAEPGARHRGCPRSAWTAPREVHQGRPLRGHGVLATEVLDQLGPPLGERLAQRRSPVDHPGTEVAHGRLEARDPMPGVGAAPRLRGDHTRPWRGAHLAHTRQKAT
jgi:hypothetical protein